MFKGFRQASHNLIYGEAQPPSGSDNAAPANESGSTSNTNIDGMLLLRIFIDNSDLD